MCDSALFKSTPHLYSPEGPTSEGKDAVTLLPRMCTDGKRHYGYQLFFIRSLIKEDEQKTITGSLLPESQKI